jgi:hypothetical protein
MLDLHWQLVLTKLKYLCLLSLSSTQKASTKTIEAKLSSLTKLK